MRRYKEPQQGLLELQPEILLRNKDKNSPLTYADGAVGCLYPLTQEFVTSPTATEIPIPPFGSTRDLYRRADGLYGEDDPIQHPQPYNSRFPYMPCIPKEPHDPQEPYYPHQFMWTQITKHHLDFTSQGAARGEGVLKSIYLARIDDAIGIVNNRMNNWKTTHHGEKNDSILSLLTGWENNLEVCYTRVKTISSSLYDTVRVFAELKRCWLTMIAILDYDEKIYPRIRGLHPFQGPLSNTEFCMGAFVWNDADALQFFKVGLPFYYVRHYNQFDRQNIINVKSFQPSGVCTVAANPPYSVIYTGQAGSDDKFAAIYKASVQCISGPSPFANMHLPGQYQSSYQLSGGLSSPAQSSIPAQDPLRSQLPSAVGPIRKHSAAASTSKPSYVRDRPSGAGKSRSKVQNATQQQRDVFADLPADHRFVPTSPSAWVGIKKLIDPKTVKSESKQKLKTIVPDPSLFFGSDDNRLMSYLTQWRHVRPIWLKHCRSSVPGQPPVENGIWRKALGQQFFRGDEEGEIARIENRQHQDALEAKKLLLDIFQLHSPGTPIKPSSPDDVSITEAKKLIRELSLINFHYQLVTLDYLVDTSRPRTGTSAQLTISTADHDQSRNTLISNIFAGGDVFTVSSETSDQGMLASDWAVRIVGLRALWRLMDSWSGEKPTLWNRGADGNLHKMQKAGEEWERALALFYAQTYYTQFGHPPVLPTRL
ncbi:hypothetical protein K435DRAFT_867525 [Dendrothele bispora CBS 962.96]|uniref:Uncharacterized protein n=1 Tax=Dendrothele bispora (strain CBS 962.96) TaxID=1314807 RepID=A0A4S8LE29_DENBC|nr:hypothetical protein K435DRAFT_867525 [Dendrothele bispora CBS 962.96]